MKHFLKALLQIFLTSMLSIVLMIALVVTVNHLADKYGIDEYAIIDCPQEVIKHGK